jgi:hypothetical protein
VRLFFNRKPVALVDDALDLYKRSEFASATRSTVPLISLLKHGREVWASITKELSAADRSGELHLEFTVKSPQGRGKASHTDVMLIQGNRAIAFEAKWTEPQYYRVSKWLVGGNDPENRCLVMSSWLSLLQPHATLKLRLEGFGAAIYQMVHRAAAACYAGNIPTLAYVQFCPLANGCEPDVMLMNDLSYLHSLLGAPDEFPFWLVEVVAKPSEAFEELRGLTKGLPETAQAVHRALCNGPLFEFTKFRLHRIRGPRVDAARVFQLHTIEQHLADGEER